MKSIKEQLKGTCVLNESVEMGAEIVALYTEAGFNRIGLSGQGINAYYGAIFTGGFNKKGNPIVEMDDDIYVVKDIRHPKDKLLEYANDVISKNLQHCPFRADTVREFIVNAAKWGQENK